MSKAAELANLIGNINAGGGGVNRNVIINGAMDVAQRATSATGIADASAYRTVDRWIGNVWSGTYTISQSTDAPDGFGASTKFDCTTAESPGAADSVMFYQSIEGQNLQSIKKGTSAAKPLACSFWVKSTVTGTAIAELYDIDNNRGVSASYTISSANTWEYKTVTFPADTTGAFDNNNAASMYLAFWLAAGSNYTSGTLATAWVTNTDANRVVGQTINIGSSTSNDFYITGVQLEIGQNPTEFEHEPFETTLRKCQRYLLRYPNDGGTNGGYTRYGIGQIVSSTETEVSIYPPVHMRADPSLTFGGSASGYYIWNANDADSLSSMNVEGGSTMEYIVVNCNGSGFTAGRAGSLNAYNNSTNFLQFDSEL